MDAGLTEEKETTEEFIESLINDHQKFDDFIYTSSLEDALEEILRRRKDPELKRKVELFFKEVGIPEPFQGAIRPTLFRQVATPNLEVSRFLMIADGMDLDPLFLEYHEDKFTPNNEWKLYLGKPAFYEGIGKKGGHKINYKTIIDFNKSNGKKINEVETLHGHSLIDFHRSLFTVNYNHIHDALFFEASEWFKKCGGKANIYYDFFLALMVMNGILFENFLLNREDEYQFSKDVFLPSFLRVTNHFGFKPLIVPLSPTNVETAEFWLCQNPKTKEWFEKNIL